MLTRRSVVLGLAGALGIPFVAVALSEEKEGKKKRVSSAGKRRNQKRVTKKNTDKRKNKNDADTKNATE